LPPAAKQALILSFLRNSRTVHNIKDLEKALPSVASINGMQVKDYLQALSDDGKIRVEKIGSGNWYWSFLSEEKKMREKIMEDLGLEKEKVSVSVAELQDKIGEEGAAREEDSEEEDGQDRRSMKETYASLQHQAAALRTELSSYSDNDPSEVLRRKEWITALMASAERWTDNIYALESYLLEVTQDREAIENIRREYYGSEYVEGEGLVEL
jgi:Mnd1 HTH domain